MTEIIHFANTIRQKASAPNTVVIYTEGLCVQKNPRRKGCWAWVAFSDDREIAHGFGCLGSVHGATNNVAAYHAVIQALIYAANIEKGIIVEVLTDSLLVVNQVTGQWQCHSGNLIPLCLQAIALIGKSKATLRWVPREHNKVVNELAELTDKAVKGGTK